MPFARSLALSLLPGMLALAAGAAPQRLAFSRLYAEAATPDGLQGWVLERTPYTLRPHREVRLRAGYLPAAPGVPARGCVLYLQGFGDSLANHARFFGALSAAGYRVVGFDYPGQGGSEGSMNQVRVPEIPAMAEAMWARYAGADAASLPRVIGWSTGGLAAHLMAAEGRAAQVVELAPGIHVHPIVGDFGSVTPETLTSHRAAGQPDPHVDPPRPTAPALLPRFALSILKTSLRSQTLEIEPSVPGLVLLSGEGDRYVRGAATRATLARKAPHFEVVDVPEGLHEVHEEIEPIRSQVLARVLEFLGR